MKESESTDRKLMDRLRGTESTGRLLGIVATTFEMQVDFVETDFLPTLLGLGAWDDRNWTSRVALERHLAELETATLLQDTRTYRGRPRSMRIETVPVHLPGMPILHSKVFLAVYEQAVHLHVGSANLTEPGYRKNLETVAALRASKNEPTQAHLIHSALLQFRQHLGQWLTPSAEQLIDHAVKFVDGVKAEPEFPNDWVMWSGESDPLWQQFLAKWPSDQSVEKITIVSPFWSEENNTDGPFDAFISRLKEMKCLSADAELNLISSGARFDASYQPTLPESICNVDFGRLGVRATAYAADPNVPPSEVDVAGDAGFTRNLHAKIVVIENASTSLAYFGSANFTRHGWGFLPGTQSPNIETGVVVLTSPDATSGLIPRTIGSGVSLNADGKSELSQQESDPTPTPWPDFVTNVLLIPNGPDDQELTLRISVDRIKVEGQWSVAVKFDESFQSLSRSETNSNQFDIRLDAPLLKQILKTQEVHITWWASSASRAFPVNVSFEARPSLPISPGSGDPKEQNIIAYYQGQIRWEDLFPDPNQTCEDSEEDAQDDFSESGVDTSQIQSYIIREFVEALKGLNDDLKSAAGSTKGCMQLALLGSISPLALAKHVRDAASLGERTPTACGFQLVEILACLHAAKAYPTSSQFRNDWASLVDKAISEVVALLEGLKTQFPEQLSGEFLKCAETIVAHHEEKVGA